MDDKRSRPDSPEHMTLEKPKLHEPIPLSRATNAGLNNAWLRDLLGEAFGRKRRSSRVIGNNVAEAPLDQTRVLIKTGGFDALLDALVRRKHLPASIGDAGMSRAEMLDLVFPQIVFGQSKTVSLRCRAFLVGHTPAPGAASQPHLLVFAERGASLMPGQPDQIGPMSYNEASCHAFFDMAVAAIDALGVDERVGSQYAALAGETAMGYGADNLRRNALVSSWFSSPEKRLVWGANSRRGRTDIQVPAAVTSDGRFVRSDARAASQAIGGAMLARAVNRQAAWEQSGVLLRTTGVGAILDSRSTGIVPGQGEPSSEELIALTDGVVVGMAVQRVGLAPDVLEYIAQEHAERLAQIGTLPPALAARMPDERVELEPSDELIAADVDLSPPPPVPEVDWQQDSVEPGSRRAPAGSDQLSKPSPFVVDLHAARRAATEAVLMRAARAGLERGTRRSPTELGQSVPPRDIVASPSPGDQPETSRADTAALADSDLQASPGEEAERTGRVLRAAPLLPEFFGDAGVRPSVDPPRTDPSIRRRYSDPTDPGFLSDLFGGSESGYAARRRDGGTERSIESHKAPDQRDSDPPARDAGLW